MAEYAYMPRVTIVRDLLGRSMAYIRIDDIGYAEAVNTVGLSFQQKVCGGREVVVFVNYNLNRFVFAPALMRDILARDSEHLYDLPQLLGARPLPTPGIPGILPPAPAAGAAHAEQAPQASAAPLFRAPALQPAVPIVTKEQRIKRPRNSWIIYRSEKSKLLHQGNAKMEASTISTEVARMWATESPEIREYYQNLANVEARDHKQKYPDWKYKPGTTK